MTQQSSQRLGKSVKKKNEIEIAHIVGQFDSCRITKDGGGKITFEFGSESLAAIQQVQTWFSNKPSNFAIAIKPLEE